MLMGVSFTNVLFAQTRQNVVDDHIGKVPQLTICSQNLKNYSSLPGPRTDKETALIKRFLQVSCDVIAAQEVIGSDEAKATNNLERLAVLLKASSGREFVVKAGELNDASQRVGFLVATDRAEVVNTVTYRKLLLPKLDEAQKPRVFVRAPLEIQISVKGRNDSIDKQISLVNFHFKSKSNGKDDPALLQWETYRMEMAEGLRRIIISRYGKSILEGQPVILIGDRNSHFDTASAKILEGTLTLDNFKGQAGCRLNKRGAPLCQSDIQKPIEFLSVITSDPETSKLPGTFKYNKTYSFLDDILVPPRSAGFFRENSAVEGNYDSGIVYDHQDASDHAMIYSRMYW
jgi:hypothetical protein